MSLSLTSMSLSLASFINTLMFHKDTSFTIANTTFPQPLMIEVFKYQKQFRTLRKSSAKQVHGWKFCFLTYNCILLTPVKTLTITVINTNVLLYKTFLIALLVSTTALGSPQFRDSLILALLSPQLKPISNLDGPNSWLEHIPCTVLQFQHL